MHDFNKPALVMTLIKQAIRIQPEGLHVFVPVSEGNADLTSAYTALEPKKPQDVVLVVNTFAFDPDISNEDLPHDEDGDPIFYQFMQLIN